MPWRAGEPADGGATDEINPQRGTSIVLRRRTVPGDRAHGSELGWLIYKGPPAVFLAGGDFSRAAESVSATCRSALHRFRRIYRIADPAAGRHGPASARDRRGRGEARVRPSWPDRQPGGRSRVPIRRGGHPRISGPAAEFRICRALRPVAQQESPGLRQSRRAADQAGAGAAT
jgi:hypothetical protein